MRSSLSIAWISLAIAVGGCNARSLHGSDGAADLATGIADVFDVPDAPDLPVPDAPGGEPVPPLPDALPEAPAAPPDGPIEAPVGFPPGCHYDCFGFTECRDGVVRSLAHAPVPCAAWTGACPVAGSYKCAKGCAVNPSTVMSGYLFEGRNLEIFCVETQTAQLGQTCPAFTPGACLPNRATDTPDGGLSTTFLTCDQATSKCVAADGPPLVDFGASCFNRYTPVAPGTGYTYVQACPKQYCLRLVDEADGCTRSGCTAACWGDHMCPLGWYCDDSLTNLSVGHISSSPVCRPGPRNVVPKTWACLPADGGVD